MSTYLPRNKRQQVSFSLTERDIAILRAVNRFRYLQTNQIQRLVFPDNCTKQAASRRLRYLYHGGYLGRIEPFVQPGKGGGEIAYYLDRKGQEMLSEFGEPVLAYNNAGQVKTAFLQHALDLSEFRLLMETALADHPTVALHRFTCDFEIRSSTEAAIGKRRYKLYDEINHPVTRQKYIVYPDGLIILKGRGELERHQRLYFLEIDRGTETLGTIRNKVVGYNLYLRNGVFKKFGHFERFTVLIQTSSPKRAANIRKALVDQEGSSLALVTSVDRVTRETVLGAPIWANHAREEIALLKG